MVEFALVLPIFLLLVMGILDFGFLFYNYISMENSARNAARIACVSYSNIAVDHSDSIDVADTDCELTLPAENATSMDSYESTGYSTDEKKLCIEVARSLQHTGIDAENRKVAISYSYDTGEDVASNGNWKAKKRFKGDVSITVKGNAHVLTPVLGVTSDHMLKSIQATSVYKVEEQFDETA